MKFATLLTPSSIYMSRTPFQIYHNGPKIPKEMKYKLHCVDVRHKHQLQCNKINVKKIAFGNKEHTTDKKLESQCY